ncbi:uncharacterized protein [Dysidea avara]|uniref:uncharacterized protein isoform X2 n=1 Tax=Dysidea avara TaxID=196820 RepID=UPI003330EB75
MGDGLSRVLLFSSLIIIASSDFTVTRGDQGDTFQWPSSTTSCSEFSENTSFESSPDCRCKSGLTFSTETNKCQDYVTRVQYKLHRIGTNNTISTVYPVCGKDMVCSLNSTVTNVELPLYSTTHGPLTADSGCTVNYVEIIHDCMPRHVPLELNFTSNNGRLYLKLHQTVSLQGELFQVDISCSVFGTNGKLLFKFNGTQTLSNKGPFADIPPYNPLLNHSCSTGDGDKGTHIPLGVIIGASCGGCLIVIVVVILVSTLVIKKSSNKGGYITIEAIQDGGQQYYSERGFEGGGY